MNYHIRSISEADRPSWVRMRNGLWPNSHEDHEAETRAYFKDRDPALHTWVAQLQEGPLIGFLELSHRNYAEGCLSRSVPYIEGWWVDEAARQKGVGRALVRAAEKWAQEAGHREIASDAEIGNLRSIAAHKALGYTEVERIVCFRRSLP